MIRRTGAMLLLLTAATVAAVPAASAAPEPASTSIVKGPRAPIESLPWLANIVYRDPTGSEGGCTGSVVAPRVVLTAGHCVVSFRGGIQTASGFSVVTGVADVRQAKKANVSRVSRVLMFPGYDSRTVRNDAGLLILSAPVSAPALPLAGPADAGLLAHGTPLTVAGWGATNGDEPIPSPVLRWGEVAVKDTAACRKGAEPSAIEFFPQSELCVTAPPRLELITCKGDSGGPAIGRRADGTPVQVGIISKGHPECEPKLPDYFTRVDAISSWVGEWIAAVEAGAPEPKVRVPKVKLLRLSTATADTIVFFAMLEEFGISFLDSSSSQSRCNRLTKTRVKCDVSWRHNGNEYFGAVTVASVLRPEGAFFQYSYKIQRARLRCLRDNSRPSCVDNTRTGKGLF